MCTRCKHKSLEGLKESAHSAAHACTNTQFGHFQNFKHHRSLLLHVHKHKKQTHKTVHWRTNTFRTTNKETQWKEQHCTLSLDIFLWFHWLSWATATRSSVLPLIPLHLIYFNGHYKEELNEERERNTLTFFWSSSPDRIVHTVQRKFPQAVSMSAVWEEERWRWY